MKDKLANAFASIYLTVIVGYIVRQKFRTWKGPKYPYRDGDFWVLGPELFTDTTGKVICWKGENYISQHSVAIAAHLLRPEDF